MQSFTSLFAMTLTLALIACATVDPAGNGGDDDTGNRTDVVEDRSRPDPGGEDPTAEPVTDPSTDTVVDPTTDPGQDPTSDSTIDLQQDTAGDVSGEDMGTDPVVDTGPDMVITCQADSECSTPNDTCVLFETESDTLASECRTAVGAGGPGADCTEDAECASGHCFYGTFCLAPCTVNDDCPESGQTCQPFEFVLDDGETLDNLSDDTVVSADICLPDLGTMDPCVTIADCYSASETCALIFDSHFSAERRCLYAVGTGEDSECTGMEDCQTGFCLGGGFCYWACATDSDCSSGGDCTIITFVDAPGDDPVAPGCIPTCTSTDDCQDDEVCQAFVDDNPPNSIVQLCDTVEGDPGSLLDSGTVCTADTECRSGDCFDFTVGDDRCVGPCDPDTGAGCAVDTVCYPNSMYIYFDNDTPGVYTDDVWDSFATCLPDIGSYDLCVDDTSCTNNETCALESFNEDMTEIVPRCITPVGTKIAGEGCGAHTECRSGWCDEGGDDVCIGVCNDATDCFAGTDCVEIGFIIDERNPATEEDDVIDNAMICL